MEDLRKKLTGLSNLVIEFAKKMESDDSLAKGVGELELLQESTIAYNRKEYYALISGEVKAGKSSLINSILGEYICTVDGGVCTNTNTMIKYGEKEKITVYFANDIKTGQEPAPMQIDRSRIWEYVSEKSNKNNKKNVRLIVVETPNKHLKSGLVLLDTPGLGSLNPLHAATTFSMAPMADEIFLVASSECELKESEINYIKLLIECSKCNSVAHVLTHMDQGEPSQILELNKQHLNSEIDWTGIDLKYCMVSNTNLEKFNKGIINDFSTTGFDVFFPMLEDLEKRIEVIMAVRQLNCITKALNRYGNILDTLLQSFESQENAEEKRLKIENAAKRLQEIKENTNTWRTELNGEVKKLNIRTTVRIKKDFDNVRRDIESKLLMDEYLQNPEKFGGVVSGQIVKNNSLLQDYIINEFSGIYEWLKNKTGLSLIQKELSRLGKVDKEIKLNNEITVDKVSIYRNAILGNMFAYGAVGTVGGAAVGLIVGAIIGNFFIPGFGALAGAKIGAAVAGILGQFIGLIKGILNGKEKNAQEKRNKIMNEINKQLVGSQSDTTTKVSLVITEGETQLFSAFQKEIENEIAMCSNIIKGLDSNNQKRKQIGDLEKECKRYHLQAVGLQNELSI